VLSRHGLAVLHVPVPDLQPPSTEEFLRALNFIDRQRLLGRPVVVHCLMGQGRTGTVLAAFRIRSGMVPEAALQELRALCPGAVGSPSQEQALRRFAARRDWML
jgi:atypical dual specificity phosphatase